MKKLSICCNAKLYFLNDGRVKCSKCNKKYSLKKWEKTLKIAKAFCENKNALKASYELKISYATILKKYQYFRELLIPFLEGKYLKNRELIKEYDEFLYLSFNKQKSKKYIFEAHNFLAFDYQKGIYTILMPSLHKYKNSLIEDNMQDIFYRQMWEFLNFNKVAKLKSSKNRLKEFYSFLENEMRKYKGVNYENFIYYLKEIEFKFNYNSSERLTVLEMILKSDF